MLRRKARAVQESGAPVFIDLAEAEFTDQADKRIKVLRIGAADDLARIKPYLAQRISIIADISGYQGDRAVASNIIADAARESAGYASEVNDGTWLIVPYDVLVDDSE